MHLAFFWDLLLFLPLHELSMLLLPMFSLSQACPVGFGKQRSESPPLRGVYLFFFFLFLSNHDLFFFFLPQTDTDGPG